MDSIDWETIYTAASYQIPEIGAVIQIGEMNPALDDWMVQNGISQFAFITAFNPMSEESSEEENKLANEALRSEIEYFPHVSGFGTDISGQWQPEESFLIGGIPLSQASVLAHKYRQRAFIYGTRLDPPTLIWTGL